MEYIRSHFNEVEGAALIRISTLEDLLYLALLLEFILLNGNVELSQDVRMTKDQSLQNQSFSVRVLDTDL